MSNQQNDKWLEAAFENFMDYLDAGNLEMCRAAIADVAEAGFKRESELLDAKLKSTPITQFVTTN